MQAFVRDKLERCPQNCTLYTQRTNGARSCSHQYGTCGLKTYEIKARPFRNCFFHFRKTNDKRIWQARLLADAPNALNLQTSRKGHGHFPRFKENAEKLMIFPGVCCTCALQPWEQNCAVISLMVSRMQNDIRWKPTLFVFRGPKAWTTHQGSRKTGNMRRTRNEGDLNSKPPNQG